MTSNTLDPVMHNRITRYLYTGMEIPKYYPGCWVSHNYFDQDKLKAIDETFQINKNNTEIINVIVKTYKENMYTRYETIAFALTKCLLLGGPAVKEAAYKAVSEVCKSSEELMMFTKYCRLLKAGNGQGWCKSVRQWYTTKDAIELMKEVTRVRARHGRSHKTLIRKSHLKVDGNNAWDAVVKYALFGLKRAKQMVGNQEETKVIFDYIQKVEDMRHCEDPTAAGIIATQNHFTLDHVPGHLLTSQDVWDAVLPQMNLREILSYVQRIHNMGFFTSDSTTLAVVLSLFHNKEFIEKSQVTPIEVYITLKNYAKKSKPMKHEKRKVYAEKEQRRRTRQVFDASTGQWEWAVTRRHPRELKHWGIDHPPNEAITLALQKLLDLTWTLTPATGLNYLITIDMRNHMFKGKHFCKGPVIPKKEKKTANGRAPAVVPPPASNGGTGDAPEKPNKKRLLAECFYNCNITPGHAAIILALQILKREKSVRLAVFTEQGINFVNINQTHSIDESEIIFRKQTLGRVQLDAPMRWAMKKKQDIDVFINMIDRSTRYVELDADKRGGRGPGGRFGPPPPAHPTPKANVMIGTATDSNIKAAPPPEDRCPVRALYKYRNARKKPDSKLIVMSLASHRVASTDGSHEGVLDIIGVDEHVPKVIDAFSKGLFK